MLIEMFKGDCLDIMDKLIGKHITVDAIITDPPYGTTTCKWDNIIPFDAMWLRLNKIINPDGAIVLFGSEPFSSALRMSNIKNYKYDWIWNKKQTSNQLNAKKQPLKIHENIMVFNKHNYFPIMRKGVYRKKGGCKVKSEIVGDSIMGYYTYSDEYYPVSIMQDFSNANRRNRFHPTQKPIALMEYLINTYTNKGETILDFTAGSFSTAISCINTQRNFVGIELDEKYYNIGKDRILKHLENNKIPYAQKNNYNNDNFLLQY